jgi:hypothetical protein
MKPYRGPPMTLGNAAAAQVGLIVWCKARAATGSSPILPRWLPGTAPECPCSIAADAPGSSVHPLRIVVTTAFSTAALVIVWFDRQDMSKPYCFCP